MWINVTMRCPDDGKIVTLVELDDEGNAEHIGLIHRESLRYIRPLLEAAIASIVADGGSFSELWAYRDILDGTHEGHPA